MKRAIVTLLALGVSACGPAGGGAAETETAPELEVATLDGDSVALSDLRGEVVLLNVWATWCVPCRQEVPELQELHETHADEGLRVVGVTVDHRGAGDEIRQFMDRYGMTYDVWWDPDGTAIDVFGAVGVPLTVLIDREGQIAWRHLGAFRADDPALRQAVEETL
ncbi:MAG: TlpA disulfide reductase family protein [Longimicrobiales bacterium]|nr:TlpA disulfide reductase family protein [Longimicrobiales bacterium]